MYRKLLILLQKYWIVKKALGTLKKNTILIDSSLRGGRVRVNGKNNDISISEGNYKRIKIGIDGDNNRVIVFKGTYLRNVEIIVQGDNHLVEIGDGVEIGGANIVCCGEKSKIIIGEESLLASGIDIKSCDGHSIYQDGKVINNSRDIIIEKHTWIAQDVTMLKGVILRSGSVVGMRSLLTSGEFEADSIIAGFPARVLKKGIQWGKERTI